MIYDYKDAPIERILEAPVLPRPQGRPTRSQKRMYLNVISAFDIETSTVSLGSKGGDREDLQAFMYVWMYHFHIIDGEEITIIGHYWEEWVDLCTRISNALPEDVYLLSFVHNLSFEWQYMRSWYAFDAEEVFAVRPRKILKCDVMEHIEYRCSYLHSNLSLAAYLNKWHVQHRKLSGEIYDYTKIRYPWTPATAYEREYQVNDVIGLCEAVEAEMAFDHDNLYTLPLTSTGYVRRIVKTRMHKEYPRYKLIRQLPDLRLMKLLAEAFRGGDTHANRYYVGSIEEDVESWDFSSSYPAWILNRDFPSGAWQWLNPGPFLTWDYVAQLLNDRKRAILARVRLTDLRLKNPLWGDPYLTLAKGRNIVLPEGMSSWQCWDNGRVLYAALYETTVTDVDLRIILEEYDCDIEILECAHSRYGPLPDPLRESVLEFYRKKTQLKRVDPTDEEELAYSKYKNLVNSCYGMIVENPLKGVLQYDPSDPDTLNLFKDEDKTPEEILAKSNRRAFLAYSWGVWVTAWARYELHRGLWTIGAEWFLYCDTDSVKFFDPDGRRRKELEAHNEELRADSIRTGGYADDPSGKRHYLGIFERERPYKTFVTYGAKKYAYTYDDDKTHITIAGVNKKKGAAELQEAGGIKALRNGFKFVKGGGTESIYNDQMEPVWYEAEGRRIPIASNVVIKDSVYEFSTHRDYQMLLDNLELWLDLNDEFVYN